MGSLKNSSRRTSGASCALWRKVLTAMARHQPVEPSARATSSMTCSAVSTSAPRPPSDSGRATLNSRASASSSTRSGGSWRVASISAARARMRGASVRATSRGAGVARAASMVMSGRGHPAPAAGPPSSCGPAAPPPAWSVGLHGIHVAEVGGVVERATLRRTRLPHALHRGRVAARLRHRVVGAPVGLAHLGAGHADLLLAHTARAGGAPGRRQRRHEHDPRHHRSLIHDVLSPSRCCGVCECDTKRTLEADTPVDVIRRHGAARRSGSLVRSLSIRQATNQKAREGSNRTKVQGRSVLREQAARRDGPVFRRHRPTSAVESQPGRHPEEAPMSLFKELNHVSITVTDVAKAREFYTGVLGFQEIPRPAFDFPGIWYSLGNGLSLHIILNDELVRPAVEREKILARYAHFALWTEDADATAKHIEELGLPCRDVVSGPTGLRQVFVKDPDGNMVEFIGPTASKEAVRRMESPATA